MNNIIRSNQNKIYFLLFFSVMAFALSVSMYLSYSQSIRLDESQSLWIATKPVESILKFTAEDVHVPLYFIFLHFVVQFFGNNILFARLLSVLFFVLTIPVLYAIAKEGSNRKVALLSVSLFCLSPFIIWFSSEARMYTLFTFVTSMSHLFFLRMIRSNGKKSKMGYFIATIAGLYTHYFFILLLASQTLFVLTQFVARAIAKPSVNYKNNTAPQNISDYNTKLLLFKNYSLSAALDTVGVQSIPLANIPFQNRFLHYYLAFKKSGALTYLLLITASFALFVPWIIFVLSLGSASNTQPLIPPPTSYNIFQTFVLFLFGFQSQDLQTLLVSLWPVFIGILFFIFTQKRKIKMANISYLLIATFVPILLTFFISYLRPIYLPRYLILVTPTLFIIMAWILMNYSKRIASYLIVGFFVMLSGLLFYQYISNDSPAEENYRGASEYLSAYASPKDIIAVSAPFTLYPIEYSYNGSARINTIPEWNRYLEGSIPEFNQDKFEKQLNTYQSQYARVFVVLSYDQGYESKIRDYLDTNYLLEDKKKFSQDLEVRIYKLRYDTISFE